MLHGVNARTNETFQVLLGITLVDEIEDGEVEHEIKKAILEERKLRRKQRTEVVRKILRIKWRFERYGKREQNNGEFGQVFEIKGPRQSRFRG